MKRLLPLLAALPFLMGVAPADSDPATFADWIASQMNDLFIEAMQAASTLFWFIEKLAAGIARFLTDQNMWEWILDTAMNSLQSFMPQTLGNLVLGSTGLLYVALMLAGIFLILPNLSTARLVDPGRVIIWGVVLSALFILGTQGYDLIGFSESLRSEMATEVVAAASGGSDLDSLIRQPMRANDGDLGDYGFVLPVAFEAEFFPEPTAFDERVAWSLDGPFIYWEWRIAVETAASQQERRSKAQTGLAISGLTLISAWVLFTVGIIFATLTAAALVLIVFFVVSLPLGFFEFGAAILIGIVKQYLYLFAVTLLTVGLAGVLAFAGFMAFGASNPPPDVIVLLIPPLIVVGIAMTYVMQMASAALTGTVGIISSSIRTSMSPLVYAGALPKAVGIPGSELLSGAASLALTAGAAAATGGASLAATAVAGKTLSALSSTAGSGAASLARAAGSSTASHVFAAAASGQGAAQTAAVGLRQSRKERQAAQRQMSAALASGAALPAMEWEGAIDAGGFLTADIRRIEEAEVAYGAGNKVTARRHLEAAFGDKAVARQVLEMYEAGDAPKVRRMVRTTQSVASELSDAGQQPFDTRGKVTALYEERVQKELRAAGLLDHKNAATVGQIAGASVRQAVGIWQAPAAPRQLARAVMEPDSEPAVQIGDLSAQLTLNQLATTGNWTETRLESLFEATRQGLGRTRLADLPTPLFVADQLTRHGEWAGVPLAQRTAAISNALLVAETAQVQRGAQIAPLSPSASHSAISPTPTVSEPPVKDGGDSETEKAATEAGSVSATSSPASESPAAPIAESSAPPFIPPTLEAEEQ